MTEKKIPEEQEALFDMLIGMASTLEKIRDLVFTLDGKVSTIENKLDSLSKTDKAEDRQDLGNRVSRWLKHTRK